MNIIVKTLLISAILFLVHSSIEAEGQNDERGNIILQDSTEKIHLDHYIDIIIDKEKSYTIEDIVSGRLDNQFTPYTGTGRPSFGYTSYVYWVRFQVDNRSSRQNWLLEINTPKINYVTLYYPQENGEFVKKKNGNAFPFKYRDVRHRNLFYDVSFDNNDETLTFYMEFKTGSSMQIPLTIWNPKSYGAKSQVEYVLFGILIGISVVMALYNLFLYFSVGGRSYLYYVLFVVFNGLLYLSDTGLAFQFIWPNLVDWNLRAIVTFMSIGNACALLFVRSFLHTNQFVSKLDIAFKSSILLSMITAIWSLFSLSLAMYLAIFCVFVTVVLVIPTVFISLKKGYRPARFLAVAWCIFLFGVLISILVDAGVIPLTLFTKYAWHVTTVLEVILLSLALGDKFRVLREEKEKAEREVNKSQKIAMENLQKADKLKDEFLAITSHELRTPLNGIIGISETLHDGAAGNVTKEVRKHLSMIIASGRRLANLVNDILDFSKLRNDDIHINPSPVILYDITDVVLTLCQPLVKDKSIELLNKVNIDLPMVMADENRLQQILYNLIGNAIKYTDSGKVVITVEEKNDFLIVNVSDTGRGISIEKLDIIFDPFQQGNMQLNRDSGGVGIGLSITKKLIELHHGSMHVMSEVGRGTNFSFTLPISEDQNQWKEEIAVSSIPFKTDLAGTNVITEPVSMTKKKGATILIADDEVINLQVLQNQLNLEGYDVLTSSNGEDVLKMVVDHKVDLLILDIMMPKMSGYEVCKKLREKYTLTELPILMLTAKNQTYDMVTSFEVGANDYLAKPCDKQELLSRVKTLIQLGKMSRELINMNQLLETKVLERTRELQEANHDLTKVNKELVDLAQSRRELLANIAHELGTPVTLIHGYVQSVQQGLISANRTRYLEMVYSKVNVLDRLIHDLSDLSKLEAGQINLNMKQMSLILWIEQILNKLELDVKQSERQFIRQKSHDMSALKHYVCAIDANRMDQVFSNLIRNSIKYTTPTSGEISMTVEMKAQAREVIIKIGDNGNGIDADMLPHIFERFYKTAAATQEESDGTGLGLAIVKEIITLHKGRVWAESKIDEGSTFVIALPIQKIA